MKKKLVWTATIVIICAVGLFKELRPSGPFLVDYAVDFKNFTTEEMTHEILPSTSYAYAGSIAVLLLVTDLLAYKPIIILGEICTVATWSITIWYYDEIWKAKGRQVVYGISVVTTELAYFTYMYANVDKSNFRKVTSYVHAAVHVGEFISGTVGQLLLSLNVLELDKMNYLSLAGGICGLVVACFLPRVLNDVVTKVKIPTETINSLTRRKQSIIDSNTVQLPPVINYGKWGIRPKAILEKRRYRNTDSSSFSIAKKNFLYAYTNSSVIIWSIWWTLSFAIYIQVNLYVESLWKDIEHHTHQRVYNGAVHATHALISAILALAIGHVELKWNKWGGFVLGTGSIIQAVALYMLSQTEDLFFAYVFFGLFETMYQVLIIISKSEIAEEIMENSAAFIFGINSLAASIIQLILSIVIVGENGFKLTIGDQFKVYAGYSLLLGICFLLAALPFRRRDSWNLHIIKETPKNNNQEGGRLELEQIPIEDLGLGILP